MKMQRISALVGVELKKLYRDPMTLAVLLLMPVGLALIFYLRSEAVLPNDYYPVPGMNHFEYLLPGCDGLCDHLHGHDGCPGPCRLPLSRLAETG